MSVGMRRVDAGCRAPALPPGENAACGLLRLGRGHQDHDDERGERRDERGPTVA